MVRHARLTACGRASRRCRRSGRSSPCCPTSQEVWTMPLTRPLRAVAQFALTVLAVAAAACGDADTGDEPAISYGGIKPSKKPPLVTIISPAAGTTFTTSQTVQVTASASDNRGVAKVELYD